MSDDDCTSPNPLIKRLLKNYQQTAEHSLEGPATTSLSAPDDGLSTRDGRLSDVTPACPVTVSRVGGDPHRRLETRLEGERVSCFAVGGERRLCVPQILQTVLGRFTLADINGACDALRIHIALADDRQLAALRRDLVLPQSAHGCGLITLSDAQRLCTALLGNPGGGRAGTSRDAGDSRDGIPVVHRCFGKCAGWLRTGARLVRCAACEHEFDVQQFVCHSHGGREARTCHWGFDAANWRRYLHLAPDVADDERLHDWLEDFKHHVDAAPDSAPPPRKRREVSYCIDTRAVLGRNIWGPVPSPSLPTQSGLQLRVYETVCHTGISLDGSKSDRRFLPRELS